MEELHSRGFRIYLRCTSKPETDGFFVDGVALLIGLDAIGLLGFANPYAWLGFATMGVTVYVALRLGVPVPR
jgi:hypothetical protein